MLAKPTFRFYLFGPLRLYVDDQPVPLPPQPAAVCSFLILNRQRRITREELQVLFWPDASPPRAQERLRRVLYLLRQALQPHTDLIATEGSELTIAPDVTLWIDYEEFEKALMDAARRSPSSYTPLKQALELYTDDLLKNVYTDWALMEREHARQRFLTALRQLITTCQQTSDWDSVIRYARLLIEQDPLQETAYQALMLAYVATGDRSAALRQYQLCVQVLDEELGAEPLPETTRLFDDIRQGKLVLPVEPVLVPVPTATDLVWVPLVGREQELASIAAEWHVCQEGHSRLVLVTGPAGMGKTRLVDEATRRIPGPDVTVITGNCYAMEAGTPYQLISDLIQKAAEPILGQLDPVTRADLAQLASTLQPDISPPLVGNPPATSVRLQEAVTQVIRLLASSGGGLWLVTEDLHWADPASLACLNHALRSCRNLPLMVLATLRDEEVTFDSPLMDWPAHSVHAPAPTTHVQLRPLPPAAVRHLLKELVNTDDTASLTALLHRETAGNPLFVVETLRAMVEQGTLHAGQDGRWQITAGALPQTTNLPMSDVVLQVIRGRIRRLSRATQAVLTAAAVIEHDIGEKLLARLVDPTISLDLALDEILQASILEEAAPGLYQFTHLKVREIIYADTSAPRRRYLHREAANALAQLTSLADLSRLAYHYTQAGEWTHALVHHWRAAHTAQQAGALAEANRYADMAQEILDEHFPDLDVGLLPESLPAIQYDVLAIRAEFRRQAATAGLHYPPEMIAAIEALLPQVDTTRQAQASLQQATHRLGQGDLAGAQNAAERGRALYAKTGSLWGELDALQRQIDIAYRAGDIVTMQSLLDDLRQLGSRSEQAQQALTYNEMRLAIYRGDWMTVLRLAQERTLQTQLDPAVAWQSLAHLGLAYEKLGAYEDAYRVAQQAVHTSEQAGVLGLGAQVLLARLNLGRGDVKLARRILLDLLETPDSLIGDVEVVSPALALVRCYVAAGDSTNAVKWAKRAAQAMSRVKLPILYPLTQTTWALAHLAAKEYDNVSRDLLYPLELMLMLEDTSPQEIYMLRAAASHGLGDQKATTRWLDLAWATLNDQATHIGDPAYRESFLNRVPLHRVISTARSHKEWSPQDILVQRS